MYISYTHVLLSSTNKIYRHDITEILLKVALNTTTLSLIIVPIFYLVSFIGTKSYYDRICSCFVSNIISNPKKFFTAISAISGRKTYFSVIPPPPPPPPPLFYLVSLGTTSYHYRSCS